MSHLLPSAGIRTTKEDGFAFFHAQKMNVYKKSNASIYDYKWTDYRKITHECRALDEAYEREAIIAKRQKALQRPNSYAVKGGKNSSRFAGGEQGRGYSQTPRHHQPNVGAYGDAYSYHSPAQAVALSCPPVGVDPRSLIRPRSPTTEDSARPSGQPYFAQESKPSCGSSYDVPQKRRGTFTFDDWLRTEDQRQPPESLRSMCIPSVITWCQPAYNVCSPTPHTLIQLQRY